VTAVVRRRREAVVTVHGKIAVFLGRHTPGLLDAIVRRVAVRGER
jgi:hypothetical protein